MEITPKVRQDLARLGQELDKLKNNMTVDPLLLGSVLKAFEVLRDDLKRGERVEKVEQDSL